MGKKMCEKGKTIPEEEAEYICKKCKRLGEKKKKLCDPKKYQ
jgi:hypothetical protein